MKNQQAGKDATSERRYEGRQVHPHRCGKDADMIEHVIRGVRREYERATSQDQSLRRTLRPASRATM
jgi:hypothetical protein